VPASIPDDQTNNVRRGRDALLYAFLIVIGLLPFLNTLAFGFAYDDDQQIVTNPYMRSFHYLKQILTTPVWSFKFANIPTNYYRPLMSLEYFVLYQAFGPLPYIYHLASVVLHATVVVLLFAVTRRVFGSTQIAFVTAILFAVHPIHTESVAWIAGVPDLQLAAFLLLAFWFYLDLSDSSRQGWRTYAAMSVFFGLAIFSKEPAVVFPAVVTFYEHTCRADRTQTSWAQKLRRYAPLWLMTGFYLVCRVVLMGSLVPKMRRASLPWRHTIFSSFALFNEYMNKLFWPGRAALFDTFYASVSITDWRVLCGAAWALLLCIFAVYFWRRNPTLAFAVFWMVAILGIALNARWMATNVFAERYLYVPSIGFCWIVASGVVAIWNAGFTSKSRTVRIALAGAFVVLAAALTAETAVRDRDWRNDRTLFTAAVARNPRDADLRANLGVSFWASHNRDDAMWQWKYALSQNPDGLWALNNLAMAYNEQGKYEEAIPFLRHALDLRPHFSDAHLNYAAALAGLGDPAAAESQYQFAVTDSPLDWYIHNRFGEFLFNAGRVDEAQAQYQMSVNIVANSEALNKLGDIAIQRGNTNRAELYFREETGLDPYDAHAHYELVIIYGNSGRTAEALREYQLAQRTDPGADQLGQAAKTVIEHLQKK
jgi:protein O-mannosyl-transferase